MTLPRNPALEAALDDDDDDATWSIYADYLQQQDSSLGELISRELAGDQHTWDALTAHGRTLLGDTLAAALHHAETGYAQNTDYVMSPKDSFQVGWKHGFVDDLRLADYPSRCEDNDIALDSMDELLSTVLASPAARFLRGLTLGLWHQESWVPTYKQAIPALLAAPQRRAVRRLSIGDLYHPGGYRADDPMTRWWWQQIGHSLAPIWTSLPNLTSFAIRGVGIELGEVAHERLVSLTVEAPDLDGRASLATARLPALRSLRVTTGWSDERARLDDVMRLIERTPDLEELALGASRIGEAIIDALCERGDRLGKLATLRLPECNFMPTHAPAIAKLSQHLPALRVLDLLDNNFEYGYDVPADELDPAHTLLDATFAKVIYGHED